MNERSPAPVLIHLCTADQWSDAQRAGAYRPDSLASVGFVHLSEPGQVHLPANRLFAGRSDVILLSIDAARLDSPVRWEPGLPTDPDGMVFPHLYGELPMESVTSVTRYLPGPDGRFAPLP